MNEQHPEVQVISNVVAVRDDDTILFLRYDPDEGRWWLPGADVRPYQHPDERAREVLAELGGGLTCRDLRMAFVESFRGRRGWHVVFHYRADVEGEPTEGCVEATWAPLTDVPRTVHGPWERNAVARVLTETAPARP